MAKPQYAWKQEGKKSTWFWDKQMCLMHCKQHKTSTHPVYLYKRIVIPDGWVPFIRKTKYQDLYKGLGKLGQDWAPDITLEEYKNGYTLWCVDFTKDQEAQTDKFHLIQTGNLRVEVQFAANVARTLNCVVYAVFDNLLEINKQREVSIDY
ncbi:uncharacterized protein LOC130049565 [Ostrea edulis]|uniref:uncharacterized protein LOC130049565 n=1 Tax=Ostrea edulis TaxID=37623 RepID=UPI0024AF9AD2|nr:uncharacterized protein LOC130049565 [Ostrea edulis]